jgi:hypothetical protein
MEIPEGYYHKATTESFNGSSKVVIYASQLEDDYFLVIDDDQGWYFNATQLDLIVRTGKDVLDDAQV